MDYCFSCRRTLNGALVCPGCGAYAPDIAPPPYHPEGEAAAALPGHGRGNAAELGTRSRPPAFSPFLPSSASSPSSQALALLSELAPVDADTDAGPAAWFGEGGAEPAAGEPELGPASMAPTLHRGRAARRRQWARWQKNRRRAGAAAAFALFGGGLTMAAMPHHAGRGGTTASAVTPVNLTSLPYDRSSGGTPQNPSADPGTAHPATAGTPRQHDSAPHTSRGSTRPDHLATAPAPSSSTPDTPAAAPASYQGGTTPSSPSQGTTATPPTDSSSPSGTTGADSGTTAPGSTGSTGSTGSGSTSGSGSTGSGSTGSTGSGSTAGSGSTGTGGSTTTTPPSSTTPTPPPHQLCLLVLCVG
jgi:hypothetical protein